MGKKEKYGNYLCKVGYLDVRQKIEMPRKRTLNNGELQTIPGKVELFVYHGKHKLQGPFTSSKDAINKAENMISDGIKYERYNKS